MGPPLRILVSSFGSAGDLFPLVPLVLRLKAEGHDVRCAASRSLGLYLRASGVPAVGLGDGSEMAVVDDSEIFTTRFDGWSSWRRTLNQYVARSLAEDVNTLDAMFKTWRPDVVVASGFAAAARLAARRAEVPLVNASIYPQHRALQRAGQGFARDFTSVASSICDVRGTAERPSSDVLWGVPADLLMHDPVLLDSETGSIGFPYWDEVPVGAADLQIVDARLRGPGPHVVVTLGSFVGLARRGAWLAAAAAVATVGVSAVFVGARGKWADEAFADRPDIVCVGFVPLAPVFARASAAIHHGGLGTTFGALAAGCPAVVLPQAFDQSYNARLVERAGVGLDGSTRRLDDALSVLLSDPRHRRRTVALAQRLIPTEDAVEVMASLVHRRAASLIP